MKATEVNFADLFSGANTRFTIPTYQRNYAWQTAQCLQLWNDLRGMTGSSHFFGSVVLSFQANGEYLVIDGQQRLTTVSLLWAAMLRFLPAKERLTMGYKANLIFGNVCYAMGVGQFAPRMKLVERDAEPYRAIIDEVDLSQHRLAKARVVENFDFFCRKLSTVSAQEREAVYDATCRLVAVRIDLEQNDNPQLIFESLNATGLQLESGDKIRNYMLMGFPSWQQETLYKNYWATLEDCTGFIRRKNNKSGMDFFFREYMAAKEGYYTPLKDVYSHFKLFFKKEESLNKKDVEAQLKDITRHARLLSQFANAKTDYASVNTVARRLAYLNFSTVYPFAMKVLGSLGKGDITEDDAAEAFRVVEAYLVRRIVCRIPSNALNKIMPTLYPDAKEIMAKNGNKRLSETVAAILTRKSGSGTFPTDEKFAKAWKTKDVYSMKGDVRSYILAMFNETMPTGGRMGKEALIEPTVTKLTSDGKNKPPFSIEHVMPQTLSDNWETDLGGKEAANATHERWLHTIANLTITGYNPELNNGTFNDKVKIFKQSPLPINDYIKRQTHWGEEQLEERLKLLADNANRIWPRPKVCGFDNEVTYDDLTADSDTDDFTNTWFVSGTVCERDIAKPKKSSWKSVFIAVVKMLDLDFHADFDHMANAPDKSALRNENGKDKNSCEIGDGIYAQLGNQSAKGMATVLRQIVDFLKIDRSLVRFKVQPHGAGKPQAPDEAEPDNG